MLCKSIELRELPLDWREALVAPIFMKGRKKMQNKEINSMMSLIRRVFSYLSPGKFKLLHPAFVRIHLEYMPNVAHEQFVNMNEHENPTWKNIDELGKLTKEKKEEQNAMVKTTEGKGQEDFASEDTDDDKHDNQTNNRQKEEHVELENIGGKHENPLNYNKNNQETREAHGNIDDNDEEKGSNLSSKRNSWDLAVDARTGDATDWREIQDVHKEQNDQYQEQENPGEEEDDQKQREKDDEDMLKSQAGEEGSGSVERNEKTGEERCDGQDEEPRKVDDTNENDKEKNHSERKGPRITAKLLKEHCRAHGLYLLPRLNDVLYLHFKGFTIIENLEEYTGLKCLWLDNNAIRVIEGLSHLQHLRCLYLQNNLLDSLEGLQHLRGLVTLNVANNRIVKLEYLAHLSDLTTLDASHNRLATVDDVAELRRCPKLSCVDIAHNQLQDPDVVQAGRRISVLSKMENLHVLRLTGNAAVRQIRWYRSCVITACQNLRYLDERPVFPVDRAAAEAWYTGGVEAEKAVRREWAERDRKNTSDCAAAVLRLRERVLQKKRNKKIKSIEPAETSGVVMSKDDTTTGRENVEIPIQEQKEDDTINMDNYEKKHREMNGDEQKMRASNSGVGDEGDTTVPADESTNEDDLKEINEIVYPEIDESDIPELERGQEGHMAIKDENEDTTVLKMKDQKAQQAFEDSLYTVQGINELVNGVDEREEMKIDHQESNKAKAQEGDEEEGREEEEEEEDMGMMVMEVGDEKYYALTPSAKRWARKRLKELEDKQRQDKKGDDQDLPIAEEDTTAVEDIEEGEYVSGECKPLGDNEEDIGDITLPGATEDHNDSADNLDLEAPSNKDQENADKGRKDMFLKEGQDKWDNIFSRHLEGPCISVEERYEHPSAEGESHRSTSCPSGSGAVSLGLEKPVQSRSGDVMGICFRREDDQANHGDPLDTSVKDGEGGDCHDFDQGVVSDATSLSNSSRFSHLQQATDALYLQSCRNFLRQFGLGTSGENLKSSKYDLESQRSLSFDAENYSQSFDPSASSSLSYQSESTWGDGDNYDGDDDDDDEDDDDDDCDSDTENLHTNDYCPHGSLEHEPPRHPDDDPQKTLNAQVTERLLREFGGRSDLRESESEGDLSEDYVEEYSSSSSTGEVLTSDSSNQDDSDLPIFGSSWTTKNTKKVLEDDWLEKYPSLAAEAKIYDGYDFSVNINHQIPGSCGVPKKNNNNKDYKERREHEQMTDTSDNITLSSLSSLSDSIGDDTVNRDRTPVEENNDKRTNLILNKPFTESVFATEEELQNSKQFLDDICKNITKEKRSVDQCDDVTSSALRSNRQSQEDLSGGDMDRDLALFRQSLFRTRTALKEAHESFVNGLTFGGALWKNNSTSTSTMTKPPKKPLIEVLRDEDSANLQD
ncbi:uncharacterized protein LOC143037157 [Oratosquilla oratoria]|uniref:uncharacterized protein LOC143037157 n=1 Tax=Oratosquilla oratoria TaxID=337810 RepID=UPI003F76F8EE